MTTAASPDRRPWLFGPAIDLAAGCGGLYVLVFAALAVSGDAVRAAVPLGLTFVPILFLSVPHYGATLLRAYGRDEDRRRYRFFAVWTTLALAVLLAASARSTAVASWTVTIYLTWSPWHYAAQNYGVGMTFLRRAGVEVTPRARLLYRATFVLSYLLAALALHGTAADAAYAPADLADTSIPFRSLGIPDAVRTPLLLTLGGLWAASGIGAALLLSRRAPLRALLAPATLVASQALWFAVPALTRATGVLAGVEPFSQRESYYGFLWIASAHALQYLWIAGWYASRSGGAARPLAHYAKCLAAGALVWTLPGLLLAPSVLGTFSYDTGLAIVVASAVNLHHFVLDGVIWKLRDGPVARILLGPRDAAPTAEASPSRIRGAGALVVAAGTACAALTLYAGFELEYGFVRRVDAGDTKAAAAALDRLALVGRDGAGLRLRLAARASEAGDAEAARRAFEESIRLEPNAWSYVGLGRLAARRGDWPAARRALDAALELEPGHAVALLYSGVVDLETGSPDRGRAKVRSAREAARNPAVRAEAEEVLRIYADAPR